MIRPGIEPTYVRRNPRISASSRMPPRLWRMNLRSIARAIERPSEVLPTPGGPTKQRITPSRSRRIRSCSGRALCPRCSCLALLAQLAHGQEFEDALLDVLQAIVVFVQHLRARARCPGCPR